MKVIFGLCNPERRYDGTRHNVGGEVVEAIANRWSLRFRRGPRRVAASLAQGTIDGVDVILALPRVSMNVSGPAVAAVLRYYGAGTEDLLVVHDDIDLPFGRLRLHRGRGTGGHNGVRSIVATVGSRDFYRLKVGVGRPPGRMDPAAFVLQRFDRDERHEIDLLIGDAADVVEQYLVDPESAVQAAGGRRPEDPR
ncbi:MAG TPA: aminoacyl-tRNA hydrolase [Actinobacteria bacterium]|nr:peptidyl-tRNA hydrolase [bacterium BMS3Bbin01]HDH27352.1 aminoacyl-tRNA hydrolase [Actinomycetota bacterium]